MMLARRTPEVLLVEDNPGDVRLTVEAVKESEMEVHLSVAGDGIEALDFLRKNPPYEEAQRPDLILLDLNLPRLDGREVLAAVKQDKNLKTIPVIVLSTSSAVEDILKSYELHANCYIVKPVSYDEFVDVIAHINYFWLKIVILPE